VIYDATKEIYVRQKGIVAVNTDQHIFRVHVQKEHSNVGSFALTYDLLQYDV